MPYVAPGTGLALAAVDLERLAADQGPPPWRVALTGTPRLRAVVVRWPPGYATVPHRHPRADEIFLVLEGSAGFTLDDEPERTIDRGGFVHAGPGVLHAIRVLGDEALTMVAAVGPNEDATDETIEHGPDDRGVDR